MTSNTAAGFGGGVAACKNGMTLTKGAAIYGNEAAGTALTRGDGQVLGDGWAADLGITGTDAMDYYGAGETTAYSMMLGGGQYDWAGYMSASPTREISILNYGWQNKSNKISVDGSTYASSAQFSGPERKDASGNTDTETLSIYLYSAVAPSKEAAEVFAQSMVGSSITVKRDGMGINVKGIVSEAICDETSDADGNWPIRFKVNTEAAITTGGGRLYTGDNQPTMEGLEYFKAMKILGKEWSFYRIASMPKDASEADSVARAHALRLMALTANPNSDAIAAAQGKALVFITGNTSAANGGGIACNGIGYIGEKPDEEPPDEPTSYTGSLTLQKSFDRFDAASGEATVIFNIKGYASEGAYAANPDQPYYEKTITTKYTAENANQVQSFILQNLPRDSYFVIEEVDYDGKNYVTLPPVEVLIRDTVTVVVTADRSGLTAESNGQNNVTVNFVNSYKDDGVYSTGAINEYTAGTGGFVWHERTTGFPDAASTSNEGEGDANA